MTKFTTLDELYNAMRAGEIEDWAACQTFGGNEPSDTSEIWSWDNDRLIVGSCASDLKIMTRAEWSLK